MSQLGSLFPIYGKKTCSKPPTRNYGGNTNKSEPPAATLGVGPQKMSSQFSTTNLETDFRL